MMLGQKRSLRYPRLDDIDPGQLMALLNNQQVRQHLIEHPLFDPVSLNLWLNEKLAMDATPGCRVRGIIVEDAFAGWCGLQLENGHYEIAIVLDPAHWGLGSQAFYDIMTWAKEFGHETVFIHLLQTRPEYGFLRKISKNVFHSKLFGHTFITYELSVK